MVTVATENLCVVREIASKVIREDHLSGCVSSSVVGSGARSRRTWKFEKWSVVVNGSGGDLCRIVCSKT